MWIFAARWTEQVYVCATLYISDQVNSDWIITMTALYYLIQSFIWKFSQLSNSGVNVELRFNCVNGRVNANLTADIGSSKPESAPRSFSGCKSKPSRIRRRNRRRAARLNENSEKDVNNHHNTSQSSVGEFYSDDNLDTNLASNDVKDDCDPKAEESTNQIIKLYDNPDESIQTSVNFKERKLPTHTPSSLTNPIDFLSSRTTPRNQTFTSTTWKSDQTDGPVIRVVREEELNLELKSLGMLTTHELEAGMF